MDGTLGFHTPANWRLNLPSGSDRLGGLNRDRNRLQSKHKWIINCGYRWYRPDIQVNVMLPLGALGNMKVGARNQAVPTHYIDLFPSLVHPGGHAHAGQPVTQEYYRGSQWARAQYVASQLLNPTVGAGGGYVGSVVLSGPLAALTVAQPAWLMKELHGFFSIFIAQVLVSTELKCFRDNAVRLGNGQNKNLHFNLIKACVNDLTRSFPVAVTSVLTTWWSAAHMPGANAPARQLALITNILRLLRHNTGVAANGQLGFQMVPAQGQCLNGQFDAAFQSEMERAEVSLPFKSRGHWSGRYNSEDNLQLGHLGVSENRDLTGIDNWQCYHKPLPFEKAYPQQPDKNYHSTAVLVELRYPYMPINQGFMPTWGDPANIANIAPTLDLIRAVASS